jgi:Dolichyl-phosphate-mannose-protein mannosyltransferase
MSSARLKELSGRRRSSVSVALSIVIVANVILIAAFVLGRGGQRTVVELSSASNVYSVKVDGTSVEFQDPPQRDLLSVPLKGPQGGTINLLPLPPLSSFPGPSGIDSVAVILPTGEEVFHDEFDTLDLTRWRIDSGRFEIVDGVLVPSAIPGPNSLTLMGDGWQGDYSLRVTYRNSRGGTIGSHVVEGGAVYYRFELVRDFPNFFDVSIDGVHQGIIRGGLIETSGGEALSSIAYMVAEPYPYFIVAIAAGVVLTLLASGIELKARGRFEGLRQHRVWVRLARHMPLLSALVLAAIALTMTQVIGWRYYGFVPHYPDEVLYVFQARLIAAGRFVTDIPGGLTDAFYISTTKPAFVDEIGGKWASFYPFGHPLMLAIGSAFGLTWLVPSVVGAGTVVLTYVIGRRFYNARTGLAAAAFLVASPFFLMQSSNFLSHNTGTLYILLSLLFILKRDRPLLYGALAGLFFGLGVNTRPLNMAALVVPFGILMLSYVAVQGEDRRQWLKHTGAFLLLTLLLLVAMFGYNYGVTGTFGTTYAGGAGGDSSQLYGFREGHTLDIGIRNEQAQLTMLLVVFNAWPAFAGIILIFVPFLLGSRNHWDYFVLACATLPILAYAGYRYSGGYEGPRYWYEAMPFLVLLSARGVEMAGRLLSDCAGRLRSFITGGGREHLFGGTAIVYSAVAVLVIWGSGGWLFGWHGVQESPNLPYRASAIDGVFGVDTRLDNLARETSLKNALVLVEPCGFFRSSHCYSSVFLRNNIDFDGDVVWALYIDGENDRTIAAFPGRDVYVASWDDGGSLRAYEGN